MSVSRTLGANSESAFVDTSCDNNEQEVRLQQFEAMARGHVIDRPLMQTLEPRVLLDAAGFETGDTVADQAEMEAVSALVHDALASDAIAPWAATPNEAEKALFAIPELQPKREIVFIDAAIEDKQTLIAAYDANAEIYILDAESDGVFQIADVLKGQTGIDAIHILSHGKAGVLELGSTQLTESSTTGLHSEALSVIAASLSDSADILLYGCDFGAEASGFAAVQALAKATGADIAASQDLTGNAQQGGDWDLEIRSGVIEASVADIVDYQTTLSLVDIAALSTADGGTSYAGTFDGNLVTITRSDVDAGSNGVLTIENAPHVSGGASLPSIGLGRSLVAGAAVDDATINSSENYRIAFDTAVGFANLRFGYLNNNAEGSEELLGFTARDSSEAIIADAVFTLNDESNSPIQGVTFRNHIYTSGTMSHNSALSGSVDIVGQALAGDTPTQMVLSVTSATTDIASVEFSRTTTGIADSPAANFFNNKGGNGVLLETIEFATRTTNNAPLAVNDTFTLTGTGPLSGVNVLAANPMTGDSDPDGDTITVVGIEGTTTIGAPVTLPLGAAVTITSTGDLSYDPKAFNGPVDIFSYEISDGTITATATITINFDTDSDGIVDVSDIDDDNDGILDKDEGYIAGTPTQTSNIVLVVDESGSIFGPEIDDVKQGLTNFIEAQIGTGNTVSLIGMGDSAHAVRTDHVLNVTFPKDGTDATAPFDAWIADYRNGRVSIGSDYWESGLQAVTDVNNGVIDRLKAGDHIVIVTDGSQSGTPNSWNTADFDAVENTDAHLFAIGIGSGGYSGSTIFPGAIQNTLLNSVKPTFDNVAGQFGQPIAEVQDDYSDFATTDYDAVNDFSDLLVALGDAGVAASGVPIARDSDGDGIADHLDLDSDNDAITDNIEAQATGQYRAPSGQGGTAMFTDGNQNGLDDQYEQAAGTTGFNADGIGLVPFNTDGTGEADFIDTDSDDDLIFDIAEAGFAALDANNDGTVELNVGVDLLANTFDDFLDDRDGDGLADAAELTLDNNETDGFHVHEGRTLGALSFPDSDLDAASAIPMLEDVDFRDARVDAVNTAPTSSNAQVSATEDTPFNFSVSDFPFADPDVASELDAIRLDQLPNIGTLTLAGQGVAAGDIITVADIPNLSYMPPLDASGNGLASFEFSVSDGLAFSATPTVMTIDVVAVNDAPYWGFSSAVINLSASAASTSYEVTSNVASPLIGITVDDRDGNSATDPSNVTLSVVNGVLNLNETVTNGITAAQISGDGTNQITITGATFDAINTTLADANGLIFTGSHSDTLTLVVEDLGNGDGGATNASSTATANITVNADTDGDGIADKIDLDDDNDGILDTVEGASAVAFTATSATMLSGSTSVGSDVTILFSKTPDLLNTTTSSQANRIDNSNFTFLTDVTQLDDVAVRFSDAEIETYTVSNPQTVSIAFAETPVTEVRLHVNSIDQFLLNDNPPAHIGVEILSSTSSVNTDTAPALSFGDDNPTSFDTTSAHAEADGVGQGSADGTIRFYSLNREAITFLQFQLTENPNRLGTDDSWQFAMEVVADTDGDGIANHLDLDSDNDGISDLLESGHATGILADSDGNGTVTNAEALTATPAGDDQDDDGLQAVFDKDDNEGSAAASQGTTPRQTADGDGIADFLDLDSDGDGLADAIEAQATAGYTSITASDLAADSDGDGIIDRFDNSMSFGGAFTTPIDTDSAALLNNNPDGLPDYVDTDSDGDGRPDAAETRLSALPANVTFADTDGTIDPSDDSNIDQDEIAANGEASYREVDSGPTLTLDDNNDGGTATDPLDDGANDGNFSGIFIENQLNIPIVDTDAVLADVGNNVSELRVRLTDGRTGDLLEFPSVLPGLITASVFPASTLAAPGVMIINFAGQSGVTTMADWTAVLKSITFKPNTNNVHSPEEVDRHIEIFATDSNNQSTPVAISTISVVEENDKPTLDLDFDNSGGGTNINNGTSNGNFRTSYTEGDGGTPIADSDTFITDLDDTLLQSATITLTNGQVGDLLEITGPLPSNGAAVPPTSITVASISAGELAMAGTFEVVLNGPATLAEFQTALTQIAFRNTQGNPDTTQREVSVVINDGRDDNHTPRIAFIDVIGVNDAPAPSNDVISTSEDIPTTFSLIANDTDIDSLPTDFTISAINGVAPDISGQVNLPSGALVTVNANGTITYDPNQAFNLVWVGDTEQDTFFYTLNDGGGAEVAAVVNVTIIGEVDLVVVGDDINNLTEDESVISGNVITDPAGPDRAGDQLPRIAYKWSDNFSAGQSALGANATGGGNTLTITAGDPISLATAGNLQVANSEYGGEMSWLRLSMNLDAGEVAADASMTPSLAFANPVENLQFSLLDIDQTLTTQDEVTVLAYDAAGNAVAVDIFHNHADLNLSGGKYTGLSAQAENEIDGNLIVNIDGPVSRVDVIYETGPNTTTGNPPTQFIGLSDLSWKNPDANVLTVTDMAGIASPAVDAIGTFGSLNWNDDGSYTYTLNNTNTAIQALDDGESLTDEFIYEVTEMNNIKGSAKLTVTINGVNDAPKFQDPVDPGVEAPSTVVPARMNNDGESLDGSNIDLGAYFFDIDTNDSTLTYTISGLPTGLVVDANGAVSGTIASNASTLVPDGIYTVTIEVSDGDETTSTTFDWTINNPGPTAQPDVFETDEDKPLSGNVITNTQNNGADSDIDGDALSVQSAQTPAGTLITVNTVGTINPAPVALDNGAGDLVLFADGTFNFTPNANYFGPAIFQYVLQDSDGATATTSATITVRAINDAPVINLDPNNDAGTPSIPTDNGPDDGGFEVVFAEGDSPVAITDTDVAVTDEDGTVVSQLTIHITGLADNTVNGAEVLTVGNDTFQLEDDKTAIITIGTTLFQLTYLADLPNNEGQLIITPAGAGITTIDNSVLSTLLSTLRYEHTSEDPTDGDRIFTFAATQDGAENTVSAPVTSIVTVEHVNDVPTIVAPPGIITTQDLTTLTPISLASIFDDVDHLDGEIAFTINSNTPLPSGLVLSANGEISGVLDNSASQGGDDPVNNPGVYEIGLIATDPEGGSVSTTLTLKVENPAPMAGHDAYDTDEKTAITITKAAGLIDSNDADPDLDDLRVAQINGVTVSDGQTVTLPSGALLTINADGSFAYDPNESFNTVAAGDIADDVFTYTISDDEGGTATAQTTITIAGLNAPPVIIDPNAPENDPNDPAFDPNTPVLPIDSDNVIDDQSISDGQAIAPINVADFVRDVDGDPLTYSLDMSDPHLPQWLNIDASTGVLTGTPPADASKGGAANNGIYPVTIIINDNPALQQTTTMVTLTVSNVEPVAVADTASDSENVMQTGNVLLGDADGAPDSDPLVVTTFNGQAVTPSIPAVIMLTHGSITMASNGDWAFTPNSTANQLDSGETAFETLNYIISDGNGGMDTATLTITINGDDDPVQVADPNDPTTDPTDPRYNPTNPTIIPDTDNLIDDVSYKDGEPITTIAAGFYFGDAEGDTITYSADILPDGLSIDKATGVISGQLGASASQGGNTDTAGEYLVRITATDDDDNTASTTVTFTVSNINPVAVADHSSATEDDAQSGNVLTDLMTGDRDGAPDHDPLTVISINNQPVNAASATAVPLTYGTLNITANGAWTFTPNGLANQLDTGDVVVENVDYTISDGNGGTALATLSITISGADDAVQVVDPNNPTTDPSGPAYNPSDPTIIDDPENVIPDIVSHDGAVPPAVIGAHYFADAENDPIAYSVDILPPGLLFDTATGTISGQLGSSASQGGNTGTPGVYLLTITAIDDSNNTASTTVTYTISNLAPQVMQDMPSMLELEGDSVQMDITPYFDDPDGDTLTFSAMGLPLGLSLDKNTGMLSGTIASGAARNGNGLYSIIITATDGEGGTVSASMPFMVQEYQAPQPQPNPPADPSPPEEDPIDWPPHTTPTNGPSFNPDTRGNVSIDPFDYSNIGLSVDETVNDIAGLAGNTALVTDQTLTAAVNDMDALGQNTEIGGDKPILLNALQELLHFDMNSNTGGASHLFGTADNAASENFPYQGSDRASSLMADRYKVDIRLLRYQSQLYLDLGTFSSKRFADWQITMANGATVPNWITLYDNNLVLIEEQANIDTVRLSISGVLKSGERGSLTLNVDMKHGLLSALRNVPEERTATIQQEAPIAPLQTVPMPIAEVLEQVSKRSEKAVKSLFR